MKITIHHYLWYYFSLLYLVPLTLFMIYRFFTRKSDYTKYHVNERYHTYWDAVNVIDTNPYKDRGIKQNKREGVTKEGVL